jgi:hypothetical protein
LGVLRIIGQDSGFLYHEEGAGDETRIAWRTDDPDAVKQAADLFRKYVMEGWIAYTVTADDRKIQIFTFNPALDEIVLTPIMFGG